MFREPTSRSFSEVCVLRMLPKWARSSLVISYKVFFSDLK